VRFSSCKRSASPYGIAVETLPGGPTGYNRAMIETTPALAPDLGRRFRTTEAGGEDESFP